MADDDVIRDDDEDLEETMVERLVGLTEMFPESLRNGTSSLVGGFCSGVQFALSKTRSLVWIVSSSMVVVLLPYIFEKERADYEERLRQDERNILFGGPQTAMSHHSPPGFAGPTQR